jgi:hypothetical protein
MAIATCFEPVNALARFCRIVCCAKPWSARDAFIEVLEGYTLSDLVKPRAPFVIHARGLSDSPRISPPPPTEPCVP